MTSQIKFVSVIEIGPVYHRQGPSYVDDRVVSLIFSRGPVYIALTEYFNSGYPYREGWHKCYVAVTDDTEYALIRIDEIDNTSGEVYRKTEYILYIKGFGWHVFDPERNDAVKIEECEEVPSDIEFRQMIPGYTYG